MSRLAILVAGLLSLSSWSGTTVAQSAGDLPAPTLPTSNAPAQSLPPPERLTRTPTTDQYGNPLVQAAANIPSQGANILNNLPAPPPSASAADILSGLTASPLQLGQQPLLPGTASSQGFSLGEDAEAARLRAEAAKLQRLQHPRHKGQQVDVFAPTGVALSGSSHEQDAWLEWKQVLVAVDVPAEKVVFEASRQSWEQFEAWAYRQCLDAHSRGYTCALHRH